MGKQSEIASGNFEKEGKGKKGSNCKQPKGACLVVEVRSPLGAFTALKSPNVDGIPPAIVQKGLEII